MIKKFVQKFKQNQRSKEVKNLQVIHAPKMQEQAWKDDKAYQKYLDNQLERTLVKKHTPIRPHLAINIDRIAETVDLPQSDVLCIGCRNLNEIKYFDQKGARSTVGIDIFSESDRVIVMDMHKMMFDNSSFNVVYSAHSLEHAYDPQVVANEVMRIAKPGALIAIEVPYDFEPTKTDLFDYGSVENVHQLFKTRLSSVVWAESIPAKTGDNIHGTAVLRTGFYLD
ncbi:MAG: class I SAM-dependent methyltransferase [Chloroflexota bacterium]